MAESSVELIAPTLLGLTGSSPPDESGQVLDGWPMHLKRRFAMRADQMRIGRTVCAEGTLLAVLSDTIAHASSKDHILHALSLGELIPSTDLFATHRPILPATGAAIVVLNAVRE